MQAGYPGSWYAASAGPHDDYSVLSGDHHADVCIIGGGFTGLSAALTLAEAGRKVILLEAHTIGWGASGRNGGQMIRGFVGQERMARHWGADSAKAVKALTFAGHDLIRRRIDDYDIQCDLVPGWVEVAHTPRQLAELYHHYNEMESQFPDRGWHYMGAEELSEKIGTDHYVGGMLSMSDGHLHPLKLCLGMARGAAKLGVSLHEHSAAIEIVEGDQIRVMTSDGSVMADQLLLAANAHHHLTVPSVHGLASAAGSYIIATEPLSQAMQEKLNPNRWAICDTRKVCDYFRLSSDGRVLFGGRVNYSGRKPTSIKNKLMPRLLKVWPELEGIAVEYEWGGRLGVAVGKVPLLGKASENIWYAFGYTGHGVNMGNLCGQVVGEAILGQGARFDLFAKMPQRRLPLGHLSCARWLGQQAVSLAILYYWMRDRL